MKANNSCQPPRRRLALASMLAVFLSLVPAVVHAQFTYVTYNGTVAITGYTGSGGTVNIPDNIEGLPVTGISGEAFQRRTDLTGVTIPGSVIVIGYSAFSDCTNLTSVTLGNGVTWIDDYAFSTCKSLHSIILPDSVSEIGYNAFDDCVSLSSVTLGSGVKSIKVAAFYHSGLTNLTIPSNLTNIEFAAFAFCTSLRAITVDVQNPNYSSVDGVLFNKSQSALLQHPGGKAGIYETPSSVTDIGYDAFVGSTGLTRLIVGNSVTNIANWTFAYSGLTNVFISDSVTSLGTSAFYDCTNLNSVRLSGGLTKIATEAFANCGSLTQIAIPANVTAIERGAFSGCGSLLNLTIPARVASIGDFAFSRCTNLTGVYFQGNAPTADTTVFLGDDNVTVYYLPGTSGWGPTFAGRPTALWLPQPDRNPGTFGIHNNQFGFKINWASGMTTVIEACTNLSNPSWSPIVTKVFSSDGTTQFSDPDWANYPARFYRVRWP